MPSPSETLKLFLRKTFDIREGELLRALLMQLNIFLIISTLLIVKPTVNGLFLSRFGVEQLPFAFILVALVAAIVSTLYSRGLSHMPLIKLMTGTLAFSVISLILFGVFLRLDVYESPVLYLFYIWVAIFALLTTSQFWVLANLVFNAREAKRLFGFIGAGAIAGGIFGGYLTSVLAQITSSENLPFICAGLLTLCIPLNRTIWSKNVARKNIPHKEKITSHPKNPWYLIRHSRHLTYLASIVGVSVAVAKLVDYLFSGLAASFIPDPDNLTAFLGFWFATMNVISLLIQLFFTRKVVGTFGVGYSLFFLPVAILIALLTLLTFPELLAAAVFLKMADGGLKQSINKAAMELLILPIPTEVKTQTKTFIDVFVDSLATGISGLILIFLIKGLELTTFAISLMVIALIFIWIYLAMRVRKEYLEAFKAKIDQDTPHPDHQKIDLSNHSVWGGVRKVLETGNEKQIVFVLKQLIDIHDERLFYPLRRLLSHPAFEVRAMAIQNLYFVKKKHLDEYETIALTRDISQSVKIAAFEYYLAHFPHRNEGIMGELLRHPDERISGAALVGLATETQNNPHLKRKFNLEACISKKLEAPNKSKLITIALLMAIGRSDIPGFFPFIEEALNNQDPEIITQAITSAGETLSLHSIDQLISFLPHSQYGNAAHNALLNFGKDICGILIRVARDGNTPIEIVHRIPKIIKKIGSQRSVDFLFELLDDEDRLTKKEALRGLNELRNHFPHLRFSKKSIVHRVMDEARLFQEILSVLYAQISRDAPQSTLRGQEVEKARKNLIGLLENKLDHNLERIFRLLGLKYPSGDIFSIYKGLRSNKPDLRVNAIEFLDNLLEPNLKKVLIPIIETTMLETISEDAIKRLNLTIPDEYECFSRLLQGRDQQLKQAVLHMIILLKEEKYLLLVRPLAHRDESMLSKLAEDAVRVLEEV